MKEASRQILKEYCLDGEIGRHKRLKISRFNRRAGSIPAPGTILKYNWSILCVIGLPTHVSENSIFQYGLLAQLVERLPYTQNVGGSRPSQPTKSCPCDGIGIRV